MTARALDVNGTTPRVTILDGNGNLVSQQILANGAGMFTVQASDLSGGGNYVIEAGPNTAIGSPAAGNYALVAQFGTTAAQLTGLTSARSRHRRVRLSRTTCTWARANSCTWSSRPTRSGGLRLRVPRFR